MRCRSQCASLSIADVAVEDGQRERRNVGTYTVVIKFFFQTYATHDLVAETDTALQTYTQSQAMSLPKYPDAPEVRSLMGEEAYDEYMLKAIVVEWLQKIVRHTKRLYCSTHQRCSHKRPSSSREITVASAEWKNGTGVDREEGPDHQWNSKIGRDRPGKSTGEVKVIKMRSSTLPPTATISTKKSAMVKLGFSSHFTFVPAMPRTNLYSTAYVNSGSFCRVWVQKATCQRNCRFIWNHNFERLATQQVNIAGKHRKIISLYIELNLIYELK